MKYTELKKDISQGDRRVYLFEGEDAYFLGHAEEQVKAAFLTMPELNYASFDGASLKGKAMADLVTDGVEEDGLYNAFVKLGLVPAGA